jgi:hypothetical protein
MKWKGGARNGNILDQRGLHPAVKETMIIKAADPIRRVREKRFNDYVKKNPDNPLGGIVRADPDGAPMPARTRRRVEQLIEWKSRPPVSAPAPRRRQGPPKTTRRK